MVQVLHFQIEEHAVRIQQVQKAARAGFVRGARGLDGEPLLRISLSVYRS